MPRILNRTINDFLSVSQLAAAFSWSCFVLRLYQTLRNQRGSIRSEIHFELPFVIKHSHPFPRLAVSLTAFFSVNFANLSAHFTVVRYISHSKILPHVGRNVQTAARFLGKLPRRPGPRQAEVENTDQRGVGIHVQGDIYYSSCLLACRLSLCTFVCFYFLFYFHLFAKMQSLILLGNSYVHIWVRKMKMTSESTAVPVVTAMREVMRTASATADRIDTVVLILEQI